MCGVLRGSTLEVCRVFIGRLFIHILYYTPVIGPRKAKKKKFTRGLYPLTSCQEDRLGLDYTLRSLVCYRLIFFSLAARSSKRKIFSSFSGSEASRIAPTMEIRTPVRRPAQSVSV